MITVNKLEELGLCQDGIERYLNLHKDGIFEYEWNVEKQVSLIRSSLRKYFGWFIEKGLLPLYSMSGTFFIRDRLDEADLRGVDFS